MMATAEATTTPIEQLRHANNEDQSSGRKNSRRCSFVITGFGPFAGVPCNPTSKLISCLQDNKAQLLEDDGVHIRETHILDTSADAAKREIQGIYSRLCNDNLALDNEHSTKDVIVMLHLGVNYRGKKMQLEQCAYNEATFRVPDNNGYQPQKICILGNSSTFGQCLQTTLDIDEICSELQLQGQPSCCVSQDPGRFVCNYTYCLSLDQCRLANESANVGCHSLFLHVTNFDVIAEDDQLKFIISLLKAIEREVFKSQKCATTTS